MGEILCSNNRISLTLQETQLPALAELHPISEGVFHPLWISLNQLNKKNLILRWNNNNNKLKKTQQTIEKDNT